MPWVRYDDRYRLHRKIRPLSDRLWRLATEAIMWSAADENLTDGRIERADLTDIRPKATVRDVGELVERAIWHPADAPCGSRNCPPPRPGSGWRIHDYFDYQPSREKVMADKIAKAARQERWRKARDKAKGAPKDASPAPSEDASEDTAPYPAPPRPEGSGSGAPAVPNARRDAAASASGGKAVDPPPDLMSDLRKHLAQARSNMRRPANGSALAELRASTPEVSALFEPVPEEPA